MELGVSGLIRTKHLSHGHSGIDSAINSWLEENPDFEVIDIKFSSNATDGSWGTDALIIYRTNKKTPAPTDA